MSTRTFILCNAILVLLALLLLAAGVLVPRHKSAGNTERPSSPAGVQSFSYASSGDRGPDYSSYRAYRHEAERADPVERDPMFPRSEPRKSVD